VEGKGGTVNDLRNKERGSPETKLEIKSEVMREGAED